VRALARDLGRLAGSAAHLSALRRVRSGAFTVAGACSVDALRAGEAHLRPALDAVASLPREILDEPTVARVANGQEVSATVAGGRAALLDAAGVLVAIAERRGDRWLPRVVMRDA
jgi:tRNA pseudouridine55 synthase